MDQQKATDISLIQVAHDLRHKNKMLDVSIEKVILTKQLGQQNQYKREDQDPLEQLFESLERTSNTS